MTTRLDDYYSLFDKRKNEVLNKARKTNDLKQKQSELVQENKLLKKNLKETKDSLTKMSNELDEANKTLSYLPVRAAVKVVNLRKSF